MKYKCQTSIIKYMYWYKQCMAPLFLEKKSRREKGPNQKMLWYKSKSSNNFSVISWIWIYTHHLFQFWFSYPKRKYFWLNPKVGYTMITMTCGYKLFISRLKWSSGFQNKACNWADCNFELEKEQYRRRIVYHSDNRTMDSEVSRFLFIWILTIIKWS